jgi:hypothetical protein
LLSLVLLLSFSFFHPPPNHPKSALYPSYASLSFLSLSFFSSLSLFHITPPNPTPTSALYPPYASLPFLSPLFLFSLFLILTYVLMDNFLDLF